MHKMLVMVEVVIGACCHPTGIGAEVGVTEARGAVHFCLGLGTEIALNLLNGD